MNTNTNALPQVMILGTHHFDNPNLDYVKTSYDDILSEQRQQQVADVIERLLQFQPTHVAIEVEPERIAVVNERYQRYLAGEHQLSRGEHEQLGFRVAQRMNHTALHGIDYRQDMNIQDVLTFAAQHGQTAVIEQMQTIGAQIEGWDARAKTMTVRDILLLHNSPQMDESHQLYISLAAVGAPGNHIGAEDVGGWYTRNLKIYANISWLAQRTTDRILVIIGSGHAVLLRDFVRQAAHLALVPVTAVLGD